MTNPSAGCPGEVRQTHIESWFPKSCCNRRELRWCSSATWTFSPGFPPSTSWRVLESNLFSRPGVGWGTTVEPERFMRRQSKYFRAVDSHAPLPTCRNCRELVDTLHQP